MEVHQRKSRKKQNCVWLGSLDDCAVVFLSFLSFSVYVDRTVNGGAGACVCVHALNQFQDGKIKDTEDALMSSSKTISVKHQTK